MLNKAIVNACVVACLCLPLAVPAGEVAPAGAHLSLAQIIDRHYAARGGTQAWQAVRALRWSGRMDVGNGDSRARSARYVSRATARNPKAALTAMPAAEEKGDSGPQIQLPFVLEMMRPRMSRLELEFAGRTAVQVYDGNQGWKVRPYLNRNEVEPFTADEARSEADAADLDGPLFNYAAKGTKVALEGMEPVEGRDAYRLRLTLKNGDVRHVWIDTQSFLDVRIEGAQRRMDGRMRTVWIYQRDFHDVQGLKLPFTLETAVDGYADTHRMTIEKIAVNPSLDAARFAKPQS